MKLQNKTILIVSNEPWGDMWYSKHNWAFELSKHNLVYFVDPPKRWRLKNLFKTKITIQDYTNNLKILNYNNRLPFTRFNFLFKINETLIFKSLNKFFKDRNNIIFWSFDPYRLINPKRINKLFSIHFITDKYLMKREQILAENSDYHITVSKELTDILKVENPLVLSHGISETEFTANKDIDYKNFTLYVGGIDYRLDYNLLEQLLIKFPKETFLFIGRLSNNDNKIFNDIFIQKKYNNLIHKPPIHFKELKNYIAKAKICLAPMKLDVQGNAINHHKLLQYLAMGKPVLSAQFSDYKNNNLLIEYNSINEAINKLEQFLKNGEGKELINKRINFAKQFTYQKLINKIENFIKY